MNACAPEPGSSGVCAARNLRCATWSRRVRPWGNACRKVPGADGAGIPPNASAVALCRSASGSSMLSAPGAMSATMLVALASAAAPASFLAPVSLASPAMADSAADQYQRAVGARTPGLDDAGGGGAPFGLELAWRARQLGAGGHSQPERWP
ncbi:hypothetical protein [Streptomyces mirabilis]|uniref:hypothetical protein n=1 Tax=Streptomyces mirabilis TaxID=68239 RepID=UPI0036EBC295